MATRVLITGSGGYVGGRLIAHLAGSPAYQLRLTARPGRDAAAVDGTERIAVDLRGLGAIADEVCRGVDAIIHLAAPDEVESQQQPSQAIDVAIGGTVRLLQAAQRAGVKRFVYLSTAHVYGAPLAGRLDEASRPRPAHPYAIVHRAAEDFVLAARSATMSTVALRLSNAVGAPAHADVTRWTLVANDLCRQAATEGRLTLTSSGTQWRDFIPMVDACRAIEHMVSLDAERLGEGIFNLGSGESIRVLDVANLVADAVEAHGDPRPPIAVGPPSNRAEPERLTLVIDRLLGTGYQPRGQLRDEIVATLDLCRRAFAPRAPAAPIPHPA